MSINVMACRACAHRVYPARLWCPACGHDQAQAAAVDRAVLLAWTRVADGSGPEKLIGTVQALPDGPALVLRLAALPSRIGGQWVLEERPGEGGMMSPWAVPDVDDSDG